ncbi:glycosyltransferase [Halospeciosus flavus]|uniref:Glycosyltransferase n=1 Tax=Halospeciosus flavus TaxID=3032283 RepID=A0ABD5Z1F4_9EURY|nr:glycosyltransferase family 2 protein [Halospeciosus flavus]
MVQNRWVAWAAFVVAVVALLVSGYLSGFGTLPLLGVHEAVFAYTSFTAFVLVSGVLFARKFVEPSPDPLDERVTAIVPTYEDAAVLHHSVESLATADHPVDVVVVCEPDDPEGRETAEGFAEEYATVEVLVNPRPGSKAGGVNAAVERADTDYFGVFDADQSIRSGFFDEVTGHLRADDVVQARFVPRPDGHVESLAYDEFTLFGHCFRQLLYALTGFRMATSKALVFSRDAIDTVGGYDPEMVSEDYDFAHRCYLNRVDVKMRYTTVVDEEAAHTLRDWWGQRKRWMTGNTQVLHRLLTELPENADDHRYYLSLAVGVMSVGGAAFLVSLVPKALVLIELGKPHVAVLPLVAIYLVALGVRLADDRDLGAWFVLTPLVLPFFSLITTKAIAEYCFDFEGEWFAVEKGAGDGETAKGD